MEFKLTELEGAAVDSGDEEGKDADNGRMTTSLDPHSSSEVPKLKEEIN